MSGVFVAEGKDGERRINLDSFLRTPVDSRVSLIRMDSSKIPIEEKMPQGGQWDQIISGISTKKKAKASDKIPDVARRCLMKARGGKRDPFQAYSAPPSAHEERIPPRKDQIPNLRPIPKDLLAPSLKTSKFA